jgi:hypothetical protein
MCPALRSAMGGLCFVLLGAAGCGSSSGPKAVQLSLVAPTDGANVTVSRVFVTGSVSPSAAKVAIAGRRVPDHGGHFGVWLSVRRGVSHLRLRATAPGLVPYVGEVSVDSNPRAAPVSQPGALAARSPAGSQAGVLLPRSRAPKQSGEGLAGSTWTAAAETAYVNECTVGGGPQSYCECSLPYIKKAGTPSEIVESGYSRSLAERRKAVALVGEVLQRCSAAIGG